MGVSGQMEIWRIMLHLFYCSCQQNMRFQCLTGQNEGIYYPTTLRPQPQWPLVWDTPQLATRRFVFSEFEALKISFNATYLLMLRRNIAVVWEEFISVLFDVIETAWGWEVLFRFTISKNRLGLLEVLLRTFLRIDEGRSWYGSHISSRWKRSWLFLSLMPQDDFKIDEVGEDKLIFL